MTSIPGQIVQYSTFTSITPFKGSTKNPLHPLLKRLSVWDPVIHDYTFPVYSYNPTTEELRIPAGIPPTFISRYLLNDSKCEVDYTVYSEVEVPRQHPPRAAMLANPRSNVQVRALEFLVGQPLPQRFLALDTGDGKTFCTVYYTVRTGQIPAIFVSSLKLLEQWKEKILEYTNIPEEEILLVADGGIDRIDFDKSYQFLIFSHRTVGSFLDKGGDLNQLLQKLNYTIKIFDEAHLDMESIARIDRETTAPSLYVTATPKRTSRDQDELYQRMYSTAPKFHSRNLTIEEQNEKYHNVIVCKFNSGPSMDFLLEFKAASATRGFNVNVYSTYILEQKLDIYTDALYRILYQLVLNKGMIRRKTVILVKSIKLLDAIREDIKGRLEADGLLDLNLTRFHSKVPTAEKKDALDGDIIFSTDSSLSTAIDIADLETVISLIPTSSETLTSQMLGRLRNIGKPVYYIDMVDAGFKECVTQLGRRRQGVYRKKAKTLKEISI